MKTLSLELSKKLTALCDEKGIAMPESEFMHSWDDSINGYYLRLTKYCDLVNVYSIKDFIHAYDLSELLEWLPEKSNYNCGEDIIEREIEHGNDGSELVTGCNRCFVSFCD